MMGFMSSMTYYQSSFDSNMGFNVGVLVIIVLIGLLIFVELTQPVLRERTIAVLGRLRLRFNTVVWILFIIFMSMVYTRVAMMLAS